jgi:hypothetical protein
MAVAVMAMAVGASLTSLIVTLKFSVTVDPEPSVEVTVTA